MAGLVAGIVASGLLAACGGSGPQAQDTTGMVALEKRAALLNREPTALEKDVAQFSRKLQDWVKTFGVSPDDSGQVGGGDTPHPQCQNIELMKELAALQTRTLMDGDRPSRLALQQDNVLLQTCIYGRDSKDASKARLATGRLLIELSRPLAARQIFHQELTWTQSHFGEGSEEIASVLLQRVADLWTSENFSEAYGFFEQHKDLIRKYFPANYRTTTASFGIFACLHGRPSLALEYAHRVQQDYRLADHIYGATVSLAQIAQCLKQRGQEKEAATLVQWIEDRQSRALRAQAGTTSPTAMTLRFHDAMVSSMLGDSAGTIEKCTALARDALAEGPIQTITDPRLSPAVLALTTLARAQLDAGRLRDAADTLKRLNQLPEGSYIDTVGPIVMRGLGDYSRSLALLDELEARSQGWGEWIRLNFALERARTLWAKGELERARDIFQETLVVGLGHLDVRRGGSESDRRRAFVQLQPAVEALVSMNVSAGATNGALTNEAYGALLITKGVLLDALAADYEKLRRSNVKEDVELLSALQKQRQEVAAGSIKTQGDALFDERLELERLESLARERSLALGGDPPPVTPQEVKNALDKEEALVEYFSFASEDPKKVAGKKDKRTVAYVVRRAGPIRLVDLGPTDAIERAVENARQALGPTARPADSALRALGELVVEPLLPSLKGARALRIAPDAALHRVPFSALRTQAGALLDQFSITYIGTGREWARLAESQGTQKSRSKAKRAADQKGASQLSPVIFANPDFGKKGTDAPEFAGSSPFTLATRGARSAEPLPHDWQPLPGTGKEARRLSQLFPQGRTFLHQEATETALKSVQHPDILHVASHGYFLPPDDGGGAEALAEDPLLHSGVVLAFANAGGRGVDDGFLTAFEVAGMDLGGTQIATLSACETGLGQVNGEGIFGLRRALAIAGAESQLLSLWKVDDDATLEFMSAFYQRVAQGESREDALLGVQRAMAAARPLSAQSSALAKKFQHPYFWSAFVLSGDPGTLPPPIDMKDAAGVASR